jgi:hypothetical protein
MATKTTIEDARARRGLITVALVTLIGVAWPLMLARKQPFSMLRHPATIDSAYFAFALWAGACLLMLQTKYATWHIRGGTFRVVRWAWLSGSLLFWIHVGYAFHFGHKWSHANAVQHVEETSGFGPGIFVSYTFTLLWLLDAISMNLNPTRYCQRSKSLGFAIHAFLAFIVFNGTVVYGHGFMRWVCLGVFAVLGLVAISRRTSRNVL